MRNNIQKMKIDMANEVIDAGRFDMKTTMGERRQTLEDMLQVRGSQTALASWAPCQAGMPCWAAGRPFWRLRYSLFAACHAASCCEVSQWVAVIPGCQV